MDQGQLSILQVPIMNIRAKVQGLGSPAASQLCWHADRKRTQVTSAAEGVQHRIEDSCSRQVLRLFTPLQLACEGHFWFNRLRLHFCAWLAFLPKAGIQTLTIVGQTA